ncbi:ABC transporter ATP-binding protein [Roseomonas sp. BU-1]|uniref:ABC transporter ATP-binding protein n=2 Tax=Falsiroseomonas selenitidurans TaxID=2716335 RepID=A0ABX1EB37_9PROT|nr:ABC transporter ATP-binding protein [Falsiroseomonas selenitidurans]
MAPHLELHALEKRFGATRAVQALTLAVGKGELIGLLGPSGCGKTTTLRMIGGLMPASAGRIVVAGRDVTALPPHQRDMGIVFQNYALFPHMDVAQNLSFGLEMRKIPAAERAARVTRALAMVRLEAFARRKPRELSGGQQQRVALARALVIEPSILLLDEPLSNLDANLREEMRNEIRDIQQRLGITAVFVTHDQSEALAICDRIAVMRLGVLEQLGTPFEIYERPANEFVAGFVGRVNRAPAERLADGRLRLGELLVQGSGTAGPGPVTLMIRPHRIRLGDGALEGPGWNSATGTVTRRTFVGDLLSIEVTVGPATLLVEQHSFAGAPGPAPGDAVQLAWRAEDTLVFPARVPA